MKVLLVDTFLKGHHLSYLNSLSELNEDIEIVIPHESEKVIMPRDRIHYITVDKTDKLWYFKWLKLLRSLVEEIKPDIVHFLYGDDLYRYMGIGLREACIGCCIVVTFHQVRHSKLRDFGLKIYGKQLDAAVVHTEQLKNDFEILGVQNVFHVEYPQFCEAAQVPQKTAQLELGICDNCPVLLALGGTRWDKGLDLLLDSLSNVKAPFHLLVAGKELNFSRADIESRIKNYHDKVTLLLEFLSDEQFSLCLSAADIVVLPYRKQFDGASGPLGEGVWQRKMIVGANHGSLGRTIEDNHLGMTFESENVQSLAQVLEIALTTKFVEDSKYIQYREKMSPKRFQREYRAIYSKLMNY